MHEIDLDASLEVILRVLGEHTSKFERLRRYRSIKGLGSWLCLASMTFAAYVLWDRPIDPSGNALIVLLGGGSGFLYQLWLRDRLPAHLAAWQLRRVYELASRLEDFGIIPVDHPRSIELELRLSEANFALNRAGRLGKEPLPREVKQSLRLSKRPFASDPKPPPTDTKDAQGGPARVDVAVGE